MKKLILFLFSFLPIILPAQTLEEALGYGLPVVVVNTVNGEEPTAERIDAPEGCLGVSITNVTKVPGRVRIYYPSSAETPVFDSGNYAENESGMLFKLRGNTSALDSKKPFKIKLQKKADMLMRGDKKYNDKDWALIRPTGTYKHPCPIVTMVGNKVTEILRVAEWVPASMYVNLIVNDDFRGFYQLTETVKRNEKCRIDVDETTGYISELDTYWWNEDVNVESSLLQKSSNRYRFTFKYPDSDDITQEQLGAFKTYIDSLDVSIINGTYPLFIDVESCARWLLAHQLLGSKDGAGSNVYFIRENNQSKFRMGTLWDFDSSFGIQGSFIPIMGMHYFKQLLYSSPNKALAREMIKIWNSEKEQIIGELTNFCCALEGSELASAIGKSTKANLQRWHGNTLDDMETTLDKLQEWFSEKSREIDELLPTLNTTDGTIQWKDLPEGTFAVKGTEQPEAGSTLSLSISSAMAYFPQLTYRWTIGDALGTFSDVVLSSTKDYVIKESDYEHWLRVTILDNANEIAYSKDIWISRLPVLYIDTDTGKPITSKSNYVTANLRVQGNAEYEQQYLGSTEVKGRGTTSWDQYPQKPYKLKLDKKTKLFGFGKSKHWVLISNFNDKSCLRNYTASRLAKQLGVLGMDMTWVDVVLNGEVMGCYMLSQHLRVDKNSVDIFDWEGEAEDVADVLFDVIKDEDALAETEKELLEKTMEQNLAWITDGMVTFKGKSYNLSDYGLKKQYDISKGYLFEATAKTDGNTHFTTPQQVHLEVSHPEYLSTNNEMLSYVTDFWKDFEAEYCQVPDPCKNFSKYANMESMVGVWLVNEIMGQGDPTNSRYSYIADDGKLHFGPVWDFDHGGGSWSTIRDVNFFYTLIHRLQYTYYKKWFPDPVLCMMAYNAYWDVARPFIMDYLSEGGEMDTKYALFAEAGKTNDVLWGSYPSRMNPSAEPRTTEEDVEILRTFLLDHIKWLDNYFKSVETLIEVMNTYSPYPCDPDLVDIKEMTADKQTGTRKIIQGKNFYIIRNDEIYSVDGKRIK